MKKCTFILFYTVILIGISAFMHPLHSKTLEVAASDVAPFSYREDGQLKGYNFEILKQYEKLSGLTFNYELYPHARIANYLDQSNPDLIIIFRVTCEKYKDSYEIQNVLYRITPSIVLKESVDPKQKNLRIGRIRGTCNKLFSANVKPEFGVDLPNINQAMEMLKSNRLDGICAMRAIVDYSLKQNKNFKEKLVTWKTQVDTDDFDAVLCRKKSLSEDLKKKLQAGAYKVHVPSIRK